MPLWITRGRSCGNCSIFKAEKHSLLSRAGAAVDGIRRAHEAHQGPYDLFASIIAEHLIGPRPPERRKAIADAVATSWRELQLHAPGNYSGTLNPGSPRTVPFGYPDINHLHQLRVDIRPYMQGSGVKPAIPVAEMKKILLVLDRFSWDELRSMSEKGIDTARYPELAPLVPLLNTWPMDGSLSDESNTISPVKNN